MARTLFVDKVWISFKLQYLHREYGVTGLRRLNIDVHAVMVDLC